MRILAAFAFAVFLTLPAFASPVVSATQDQTVHPVLTRNDENSLIRIRINSREKYV